MQTLTVTTTIAAPAAVVWKHLTRTSDYPTWNPFITSLGGDLVLGGHLEVRIEPPGGRAMTFRPTVTALVAGERLEWLGRLGVPGVFDGRHGFTLETVDPVTTRLVQAEEFSGLLVPLVGSTLARTRAGFEAMNEALRRLAEADHAASTVGASGADEHP